MPDTKNLSEMSEKDHQQNQALPQGIVLPSPGLPTTHFVMQDSHHVFLMSLEHILLCLQEAEKQGEVPPLESEWWITLQGTYPSLR
ncbi:hypothetical protein ACU36R_18805 [Pectobacterium brasiliense]|uniref:hypothetical protein n=1 Tax=Pectobacterium brasiliense TaxID=180957 RepID=UPI00406D003F